jgi:hypothetical protein
VSQSLPTQRTDVTKKDDHPQTTTQALARVKLAIMIQTISETQQWTDVGRQAMYVEVNKRMKAFGRNGRKQNDSTEGGR